MNFKKLVISILFFIIISDAFSLTVSRKYAKFKACLANTRTFEGAFEMFYMESDKTGEVSLTVLKKAGCINKMPICKSGGKYHYIKGNVYCSIHGNSDLRVNDEKINKKHDLKSEVISLFIVLLIGFSVAFLLTSVFSIFNATAFKYFTITAFICSILANLFINIDYGYHIGSKFQLFFIILVVIDFFIRSIKKDFLETYYKYLIVLIIIFFIVSYSYNLVNYELEMNRIKNNKIKLRELLKSKEPIKLK